MPGAQELIVFAFLGLLLAMPALAMRDAWAQPDDLWEKAGHSRALWLLVIVAVPVFGAALYLRRVRPRLRMQDM